MARTPPDPMRARWLSMNRRCSAPTESNYSKYGALGILVVFEWSTDNSEGFKNYCAWVKEQLAKIPPDLHKESWRVVRRQMTDHFGPATCYVTNKVLEVQRRPVSEWKFVVFEERRKAKRFIANNEKLKKVK